MNVKDVFISQRYGLPKGAGERPPAGKGGGALPVDSPDDIADPFGGKARTDGALLLDGIGDSQLPAGKDVYHRHEKLSSCLLHSEIHRRRESKRLKTAHRLLFPGMARDKSCDGGDGAEDNAAEPPAKQKERDGRQVWIIWISN